MPPGEPLCHTADYRRCLAAISNNGPNSYRLRWRFGGAREGKWQSTTFADEAKAIRAKKFVESRRHEITAEQVYAAIRGASFASEARPARFAGLYDIISGVEKLAADISKYNASVAQSRAQAAEMSDEENESLRSGRARESGALDGLKLAWVHITGEAWEERIRQERARKEARS